MTIVLTINGESKAELVRGLRAIGEALNLPDSEVIPAPAPIPEPVPQPEDTAPQFEDMPVPEKEEKPAPKKSAKKKKEAPEPAEDPKPEEESAEETEGPTKEDVRAAAVALIKANKRDTLREILQKYDADSITTLDATQYAAVLPELKEALK